MQLKNKVCLVAGASGAIGSTVAKQFREEGAHLAVCYLSREPALHDPAVLRFPLNVRSWSAVRD